MDYTNKNIDEVFNSLKTSSEGLSQQEAVLRQQQYGFNEVKTKGVTVLDILLRQCKSPFFYLLFIAVIIAFVIGEKIDSLVILICVVINVAIGFIQEFRAERTVSLLKKIIPSKTKVMRQGAQELIEKKDVVPGDIVFLEAGDIVPAELRVISIYNFLVDESALSGESVPALKTAEPLAKIQKDIFKSSNMLFAGTCVISGKAQGVVVTIGKDTVFGHIITLAQEKRPQAVYEKNLAYFCRLILKIVLVTVSLVFVLNFLLRGTNNFFEFSLFCVALIISILPEALPAVVVLALSRGSLKMAKENVVVKRLSAIEDLGNLEILCTDKTGTLTQNILSLEKIVASQKQKAILYGLAGLQGNGTTSPFDKAIFARADYSTIKDLKHYRLINELPFDSFRMRASVAVEHAKSGEKILVTKGAPETILKVCSSFPAGFKRTDIKENTAKEGQDGKRVLAIAFKKISREHVSKDDERGLTFLGYFVFEDSLKSTAQEAIKLSKKLGVQIKMITGDSKEVAGFVGKKTGLLIDSGQVILGEDLEKMHKDEFDNACQDFSVFARISPDIKQKIIKSLQKNYEVGFLGEGINDVPALRAANIAIAVSQASDIAKEASDVVLLQKDLRVIVNGIKNGRTIFANINKYIKCTLASNFGNFYSVAVISLFIPFLPILPVQILLVNLLSDFPLIAIATDSVDLQELRKPKMYQLHMVLPLIITLALVSTVFDFIFFAFLHNQQPGTIQTLWFIESILTEIFLIFIIRTRGVFWKAKKPGFWLLFLTIIDGIFVVALPFLYFGQRFFHFVAPPIPQLLMVFLLIACYFITSEVVKLVYFRYFKPPKNAGLQNS